MNTHISRRRLLLSGATLAALGTAGALWITLSHQSPSDWIRAVVAKHLPQVRLDPASLEQFAAQLAREPEFQSKRSALAVAVDAVAPAVARRMPLIDRRIEQLERLVLSNYLLGSNFFRLADPRTEVIVWQGAVPACGNPFARFRHS